jgi:hypothetical protein
MLRPSRVQLNVTFSAARGIVNANDVAFVRTLSPWRGE